MSYHVIDMGPIKISTKEITSSVLIATLVTVASVMGIVNPNIYSHETANWAQQAIGQDIGNLLAVVVFLISTYFLRKGSLNAFFIWIGTSFYFIYAYLIYAFFIHFNGLFLVYVAVLGLNVYTLIGVLLGQKNIFHILKQSSHTKRTSAAVLLIIIGVVFELLWLSEIIPALVTGHVPRSITAAGLWVNPVHVIDLSLVLPGMMITGIQLVRKKMMGYLFVAPWLVFAALMGASIVATLIMQLMEETVEAIVPLVMVSAIVGSSIMVLRHYLNYSE